MADDLPTCSGCGQRIRPGEKTDTIARFFHTSCLRIPEEVEPYRGMWALLQREIDRRQISEEILGRANERDRAEVSMLKRIQNLVVVYETHGRAFNAITSGAAVVQPPSKPKGTKR